jgi:hypothetical protein
MDFPGKANLSTKPDSFIGGYLLILVLVFGSIFFMLTAAFTGYVVTQSQVVNQRIEIQRAGDVAEAGLNYYKWFLAHYPNDTTNGTGVPGPYIAVYSDPEGAPIGEYSLAIASSTYCGDVSSIDVSSTGFTYAEPGITRTITARYSRPTVAEYSFIINANVWAGPSRVIIGPYHSNGGIRMDGVNNSTVTSGQSTWNCTSTFGCSPSGNRDGVFTTTANPNTSLFSFPSAPINFTGLSVDLSTMQDKATNAGGIYIGPSGNYGYQITFNVGNSVTVRRVTGTTQYWGYSIEDGDQQERHHITSTTLVGTYTIPTACPLIFVQDKVWLDGVVNKKVTLAAANVASATINPSIILNGNITYSSATSSGLLAIAEDDVLVGVSVPNNMTAYGIFIAQNGRFGRNHYRESGTYGLPSALDPYVFRNSLTMNGTIVSNGRVGTQWVSGGVPTSGFLINNNTYDRNLVASPPPLVPKTSDVYEITDWREEQ